MADHPEDTQAGPSRKGEDTEPALDDFSERLKAARKEAGLDASDKAAPTPPSLLGIAFRLSTELVAALVVSVVIGIAIDRYFGVSPWGLLTFFALGTAAGLLNVMRAAKTLEKAGEAMKNQDPRS